MRVKELKVVDRFLLKKKSQKSRLKKREVNFSAFFSQLFVNNSRRGPRRDFGSSRSSSSFIIFDDENERDDDDDGRYRRWL